MYRNPKLQGICFFDLHCYLYSYFGDTLCTIWPYYSNLLLSQEKIHHSEKGTELKRSKILKYMNSRYKPKAKKLTVDNVFALPKSRKRKNTRIIFKFAGAIPVPEVNLKRRRLDSRYSQFIAGRESEGHVVVAGKRSRFRMLRNPLSSILLPAGQIFSIL